MNVISWQDYKTLPCLHESAHIAVYGRMVCMGCGCTINQETKTMGITHEADVRAHSPNTGPPS